MFSFILFHINCTNIRKAPNGQSASVAMLWSLDIKGSLDNEVVLPFVGKSRVGKHLRLRQCNFSRETGKVFAILQERN